MPDNVPSNLSAGGQLEQPCEVNNSSTAIALSEAIPAVAMPAVLLFLFFIPKQQTKTTAIRKKRKKNFFMIFYLNMKIVHMILFLLREKISWLHWLFLILDSLFHCLQNHFPGLSLPVNIHINRK